MKNETRGTQGLIRKFVGLLPLKGSATECVTCNVGGWTAVEGTRSVVSEFTTLTQATDFI
jgi:hypothetical protein